MERGNVILQVEYLQAGKPWLCDVEVFLAGRVTVAAQVEAILFVRYGTIEGWKIIKRY